MRTRRRMRRIGRILLFCLFIALIFFATLFFLEVATGAEVEIDATMALVIASQPKSQQSTINVWLGGTSNDKKSPDKVIKAIALFGDTDHMRLKVEQPANNRIAEYLILAKASSSPRIWIKRRGGVILEIKGENIISRDLEATGLAHRDLQRESFERFSYELVGEQREQWLVKATPKNDSGWYRVLRILKNKPTIGQMDVFEADELKKTIFVTSFWENGGVTTPEGYIVFDKRGQKVSFLKLLDIEVNKEIKKELFDPRNFREDW